ncbi:MAG: hypothetical protein AAF331_14125 [Pseudomonadota bacterium]
MILIRALSIVLIVAAIAFKTAASPRHEIAFVQAERLVVWQDGALLGEGRSVSVVSHPAIVKNEFPGSGELALVSGAVTSNPGQMRLKIASNSGFAIQVGDARVASQIQARIVSVGLNAQSSFNAADVASGIVFHQYVKTAIRPGAPETQAIELELSWTGAAPSDVRIIAAAP